MPPTNSMHSVPDRPPTVALVSPPALATRFALNFPTNLTVISGALKKAGFGARIIDLNLEAARDAAAFFDDPLASSLRIIERNADAVDAFGMTTLCSSYPFTLQLAAVLKKRYGKPIVLGGPQATMTAARTMELFPCVDFIVAHEGETTIVELLAAMAADADLRSVQGIYFRENGSVHATPPRPFIANLDDSPFPDFGAVDIRAYQEIYPSVRIPLDTGRGCPFQCTFCSTAMMWKRSFRMKSPARTVAEMDALHQQFGVDWFFLTQDNLTTSRGYIGELCRELRTRCYTWDCYSRCDTLTDETLRTMASAGCKHVFFGIESGSERYQRTIRKNLKFDRVQKSIAACVDQGVSFTTAYIIGFPEEDREDLSATLRSCFRDAARNPRSVIFSVLAPLPGTELADQYRDRLTAPLAFQPDFSPLLLKNDLAADARKMIESYPDLFSSFYFIRPTHFELAELFAIRNFFYFLIAAFPRTTHLVLEYSSFEPLDLLDRYRKLGLPLEPNQMTVAVLSAFYEDALTADAGHCRHMGPLIREVLRYELAIHRLRTAPVPEHLRDSQSRASGLDGETIGADRLALSPSLSIESFQVDIQQVLKAFPFEDHRYEPLRAPLELLFYEDAVGGEIVIERLDPGTKALLESLRAGRPVNVGRTGEALARLIRKGVLIYHQRAEEDRARA